MSHSVDSISALAVLTKAAHDALRTAYKPKSAQADVVQQVVTGSHLTYRYILLTALLAKATNPKINPMAIQATAPLADAYDARSLCHSVIVRHEAELLHGAFGGSNEPYLNQPARTPFLDKSNPVRGGNARGTLESLCDLLPEIDSGEKAYLALCDCIYFAVSAKDAQRTAMSDAVESIEEKPTDVRIFLNKLLAETHHGETVVLVTALLYWLLSRYKEESWTIEVHPVNEAGSSSNQIGDIDVYRGQDLIYTCEVKDKDVSASDIHHAIRKASEARCKTLHIVFGRSGSVSDATPEELQRFAQKHNMALATFASAALVEASAIWTPASLSLRTLSSKATEIAEVARMKQDTQKFLLKVIESLGEAE